MSNIDFLRPEPDGGPPPCDAFEVALDMRTAGALEREGVALLDAHLATCTSCQQYQDRARRVDSALTVRSSMEPALEWNRLHQKMVRRIHTARRTFLSWAISTPFTIAAVVGLAAATGVRLSPAMIALMAAVYVAFFLPGFFWKHRRLRRLAQQSDVVAAHRAVLSGNVQIWRTFRFIVPAWIFATAFQLPSAIERATAGKGSFGVAAAVLGIVGMAASTFAAYRVAQQSRRELAEMR